MTRNETLRNITSGKAIQLSKVLQKISRVEKFTHFDVHYVPNPFQTVIYDWVAKGTNLLASTFYVYNGLILL